MKSQKASRVDLVEKKIKALVNVIQGLMDEIGNMKDLSIGTFETIKLMPGYDLALEKLKDNLEKEEQKENKDKSWETDNDNTK